jgi:4'-phosphopantetheinyl transferase EntD
VTSRYRSGEATGIGALLPEGVVAVEAIGGVPPDPLSPEELALVANAVEQRKLDFARGRTCASRAIRLLGLEPAPILTDDSRAPIWPAGVVGSITHCRDYGCAAIARADRWSAIGIDAEIVQILEPAVVDQILVDAERQQLAMLDPATVPWPCVVFSAKEAIFKASYPSIRRWIGFHEVTVRIDPAGRFHADGVLGRTLEGRFCVDGDRVLAAVVF